MRFNRVFELFAVRRFKANHFGHHRFFKPFNFGDPVADARYNSAVFRTGRRREIFYLPFKLFYEFLHFCFYQRITNLFRICELILFYYVDSFIRK